MGGVSSKDVGEWGSRGAWALRCGSGLQVRNCKLQMTSSKWQIANVELLERGSCLGGIKFVD